MSKHVRKALGEHAEHLAGVLDSDVPQRYQSARYHAVPDAMPDEFAQSMGKWLHANRRLLVIGGNGKGRWNHEILNLDTYCEHLAPFKARLVEEMSAALEPCGVEPFDLHHIECHATLYHHGSFFHWHDDALGHDAEPVPSRKLTFTYYMHAPNKMFGGGELEFVDGTLIEPTNNTLMLFNPRQQHRVRQVECWSAHVLDGRWALMGWLHSE